MQRSHGSSRGPCSYIVPWILMQLYTISLNKVTIKFEIVVKAYRNIEKNPLLLTKLMIQRLLGSPMISLSDFDDQGEYVSCNSWSQALMTDYKEESAKVAWQFNLFKISDIFILVKKWMLCNNLTYNTIFIQPMQACSCWCTHWLLLAVTCLSFLGQIGKISKEENMRKTWLELWKSPESSLLSCQIVWKKASQVSTSRHTFQYCDHLNVPLILQLLSILTLAHLDPRSTFCQKLIKKRLQSLVVIPIATSLSSVPLIWCDVESFSLLQFLVCDITKLS